MVGSHVFAGVSGGGGGGAAGPQGPQGPAGADGRTILSGAGAPGGGTGVDGDFYIDTTASDIYGPKTAGAWGVATSLIGPAGVAGADGAQGPAGADGAQGTQGIQGIQGVAGSNGADGAAGADGADGRTVLNGAGVPGGGTGVNGDFYVDTTNNDIYGPKSAGAWGVGTSLIGPQGPAGGGGGASSDFLHAVDEKPALTAAGTFTTGAWRTRDMNTLLTNQVAGASLSVNQITLPAGTYIANIAGIGMRVGHHQTRLRDITNNVTLVLGSVAFMPGSSTIATQSTGSGIFVLAGPATVELQHRCGITRANDGFGLAAQFDEPGRFSSVFCEKVA